MGALVASLSTPAAHAQPAPGSPTALKELRSWGVQIADEARGGISNRQLQLRVRALRRLVPRVADLLATGHPRHVRAELRRSRDGLAASLDGLAGKLRPAQARFLFYAYQAQLERLAGRARLHVTPTGVPRVAATDRVHPAAWVAALGHDADGDGRLDVAERDDDADGVLDHRDRSDQGWGIPDAYQAREDWDGDADEDGSPERRGADPHSPCVFVTEAIPAFRTVAGASRWFRVHAPRRECSVPGGGPVGAAVAAAVASSPRQAARRRGRRTGLRVGVLSANVDAGRLLVARVRLNGSARLTFQVVRDGKVVARSGGVAARRGTRTVSVELSVPPPPGLDTLRVIARKGKRSASGTTRLRVGSLPQPPPAAQAAPAQPGPAPQAAPAPAPCGEGDSDGDGVPDCQEVAGFDFEYFSRGVAPYTNANVPVTDSRHVTSDPHDPNTDGDAVSDPDATGSGCYQLPDGQEWVASSTGGSGDPSSVDSDGDGLGDVEEHCRWGTAVAAVDSDYDATDNGTATQDPDLYDNAELNPVGGLPTSPTDADTDGDSFTDYYELDRPSFNPLVAHTPNYEAAQIGGVQISIPVSESQSASFSQTTTTEQGSTTTDSTTDSTVHTNSSQISVGAKLQGCISLGGGGGGGGGGGNVQELAPLVAGRPQARSSACSSSSVGGQLSFNYKHSWGTTTTHSHTTSTTTSFRQSASETYKSSVDSNEAAEGQMTVAMQVWSDTDPGMTIKNMTVEVSTICLPTSATQTQGGDVVSACDPNEITPIATLVPASGADCTAGDVTLQGNDSSNPKTVQFCDNSIARPTLQGLAANPGSLSFQASHDDLISASGASYNELLSNVDADTTGITIDFGFPNPNAPSAFDNQVFDYSIAANVGRAWGRAAEGMTMQEALLAAGYVEGTDYETAFDNPGYRPPRQNLVQVKDKASLQAQPNGVIPGGWIVMSSAQNIGSNFDDIVLMPGDQTSLGYLADLDGDGLFDREESLLGSLDTSADTDADQATATVPSGADPFKLDCPEYQSSGKYSSDCFESQIGWDVPFPSESQDYTAYASPISCDEDSDGSPDGPGSGNDEFGTCPDSQYASESVRTSDPTNPYTNDNPQNLPDGQNPDPTAPPAQPVNGFEYTPPAGGVVPPGGTISAPAVTLCGEGGSGSACGQATGYYKLTWNLSFNGTLPPSSQPTPGNQNVGGAVDPVIGRWTMTSQSPTELTPTTWLDANLELSEANRPGVGPGGAYELYFHLPANEEGVKFSLANMTQQAQFQVGSVTLEALPSAAQYLNAAYQGGNPTAGPDANFAALAVPGQDLTQATGVTDSGDAGVNLDGVTTGTTAVYGPGGGLELPAGSYRAGYGLRVTGSSLGSGPVALIGLTQGANSPSAESVTEATQTTPAFFAQSADRFTLAAATAMRNDTTPGVTSPVNLVITQSAATDNVSFPVAPLASGVNLDYVVIDAYPSFYTDQGPPRNGYGASGVNLVTSGAGTHVGASGQFLQLAYADSKCPSHIDYCQVLWGTPTWALSLTPFTLSNWGVLASPEAPPPGGKCSPALGLWAGSNQTFQLTAGEPGLIITPDATTQMNSMALGIPKCSSTGGPVNVDLMQFYAMGDGGPVPGASLAAGAAFSSSRRVALFASAPRGAAKTEVSNSRDFRAARSFPASRRRIRWRLAPGPDGSPKRVYLRYSGPNVATTAPVSDAIVLDRRAPQGQGLARRVGPRRWRIHVAASDAVSGVHRMQVRVGRRKLRWRRVRRRLVVRSGTARIAVRFRDRAGNVSRFYRVSRP